MSKSNDSFFDNMKYIEFLIEKVMDLTRAIESLSSTLNNYYAEEAKRVEIKDKSKISIEEVNKLTKAFKEASNVFGRTKEFNTDANRYRDLAIKQIKQGSSINANRFTSGFADLVGSHYQNSRRAIMLGNEPTLKNVNKDTFKSIADELDKKNDLRLNNVQHKILSFFGAQNKENEKKQKGLADYLIEGLANNRFIGGAMRDTVRLFGLLGASWLAQHFGKFGSFLGTLLYGVSEAFSGVIINGIVSGIVQGLTNVIMLAMLKARFGSMGKGIGSLGSVVGRTTLGIGGAALGLGLAGASFGAAEDSWKQGKKGNAAALGIGGIALAAGGIASIAAIFAPIVAPVAAALLGIGVLIAGIAAGWKWFKGHQEAEAAKRAKFQKELLGYTEEQIKTEQNKKWYEKLWDSITGGSGGGAGGGSGNSTYNDTTGSYRGGSSAANLFKNKRTGKGTFAPSKMTHEDWTEADKAKPQYGSMGEILNLGMMTKRRAEEVIANDIKTKKGKSYYEVVPAHLINKGSFRTDLTESKNGRITGAYMAKGTTARLEKLRAQARKEGLTEPVLNSGIGSIGWEGIKELPHQYTPSLTGHYSSLGNVFDTTIIKNKKTGKVLSAGEVSSLAGRAWGYKPAQVLVEDVGSSNVHDHIAVGADPSVKQNLQKAKTLNTDRYLVQASEIIKDKNLGGGKDAFFKWMEEHKLGDPNKFDSYEDWMKSSLMESYLKKRGIRRDNNAQEGKGAWYTYKNNLFGEDTPEKEIIVDPTGSRSYQDVVLRTRNIVNGGGN